MDLQSNRKYLHWKHILIQISILLEVLVKHTPPTHTLARFFWAKRSRSIRSHSSKVFCPTPSVLPSIHAQAPKGTKHGPSLTNNHCSYPHIPGFLIHNQVLETAEKASTFPPQQCEACISFSCLAIWILCTTAFKHCWPSTSLLKAQISFQNDNGEINKLMTIFTSILLMSNV